MKWIRHQYHARGARPAEATLNHEGRVIFNIKAFRQIVKNAKYVEIYFGVNETDRSIERLGFKFLNEKNDASINLRFYRKTAKGEYGQVVCSIGYKSARRIGLERGKSMRVPIEYDSSLTMWYVDLQKG